MREKIFRVILTISVFILLPPPSNSINSLFTSHDANNNLPIYPPMPSPPSHFGKLAFEEDSPWIPIASHSDTTGSGQSLTFKSHNTRAILPQSQLTPLVSNDDDGAVDDDDSGDGEQTPWVPIGVGAKIRSGREHRYGQVPVPVVQQHFSSQQLQQLQQLQQQQQLDGGDDGGTSENDLLSKFNDMFNLLESMDTQEEQTKMHTCYRPCSTDPATRMTCNFQFIVANYFVLSPHCRECPNVTLDCSRHGCLPADGRQRPVAVVNKIMPGPAIRVCEGDTVIVDVTNNLVGQETTIHWHGIHQMDTPWMDGVPNLTQCPIPQGTTFRYQFDTPKGGTYFWHSHVGVQRADGVAGTLVVRKPSSVDVQDGLFDYDLAEHEVLIWDWLSGLAITGHVTGHVTDDRELPRSILVHGRGFPPGYFDDFRPRETIQRKGKRYVPIHEMRVRQGWSYRFRFISNGITLCPVELSIENHDMMVIASDGFDVMPVTVESLVIQAGERFDVVVKAQQPIGSYWMKYRGLLDCNTTRTFQLGILNYEGVPRGTLPRHTIRTWEEAGPTNGGLQLNPVNIAPGVPGQYMTISELSSVVDDDPQITQQLVPDHQFYLSFDFNPVPNVNFGKPTRFKSHRQLLKEKEENVIHNLPQLNFISHVMPKAPPLTQPETIGEMDRCNEQSKMLQGANCTRKHCSCTHWLNVRLNSIVEIVLVDMGILFDAAHPFHLHGHSFRVLGIERIANQTDPDIVKQWDAQGLLLRRRRNPPIKDTVYVPDGGYTILRFRANNPGIWFFHCHIEFHSERGMALIFQVGNPNEFRRPPKNFPRCGNYVPAETGPSPQSSSSTWGHFSKISQYFRNAV